MKLLPLKKIFLSFLTLIILAPFFTLPAIADPSAKAPGYFELKVYHFTSTNQEAAIDSFLQYQYLPAMHAAGISNIGIFKAAANDTAVVKKAFVFVPYKNVKQWEKLSLASAKRQELSGGGSYVGAAYNKPAYQRIETIFMKAFDLTPPVAPSALAGPKTERVYELRSYEGASENIFRNKVEMFNQGGEIDIFSRLGFNAIFYGEVIYGSKMPNLMYMTSFENKKSRDDHWKAFGGDPAWKVLSAKPEYQNNVSHIDITFLRAAPYSDL